MLLFDKSETLGLTLTTIYKIDRSGQKEHVATLEWKVFTKDRIVLRGERKLVKDVLPVKGLYR